jgi:hypothetical protein
MHLLVQRLVQRLRRLLRPLLYRRQQLGLPLSVALALRGLDGGAELGRRHLQRLSGLVCRRAPRLVHGGAPLAVLAGQRRRQLPVESQALGRERLVLPDGGVGARLRRRLLLPLLRRQRRRRQRALALLVVTDHGLRQHALVGGVGRGHLLRLLRRGRLLGQAHVLRALIRLPPELALDHGIHLGRLGRHGGGDAAQTLLLLHLQLLVQPLDVPRLGVRDHVQERARQLADVHRLDLLLGVNGARLDLRPAQPVGLRTQHLLLLTDPRRLLRLHRLVRRPARLLLLHAHRPRHDRLLLVRMRARAGGKLRLCICSRRPLRRAQDAVVDVQHGLQLGLGRLPRLLAQAAGILIARQQRRLLRRLGHCW